MPETNPTTPPEQSSAPEAKTFTQAEVDQIVSDRLKREGIKDLKAKAQQYDALQDQSKSEITRLTEQLQALTTAQQEAQVSALRYRIAAEHGVSNEDADLFLVGQDEDTLRAQAKRLGERVLDQKKKGNYVPNEGRTPQKDADPMRSFVRDLFNKE